VYGNKAKIKICVASVMLIIVTWQSNNAHCCSWQRVSPSAKPHIKPRLYLAAGSTYQELILSNTAAYVFFVALWHSYSSLPNAFTCEHW